MPGWLRAFVDVNPVSLMTTRHARPDERRRDRGEQLGLALIAPAR